MPAFGWQLNGSGAPSARALKGSTISRGPVEQLSPITSAPAAVKSAAAASGSEPSSMRPEGSSVICAITGTARPTSAIALRAPKICARSAARSWAVPASCIRWSVVPMAPSKTTIPRAIASTMFFSAIRGRAPYHALRRVMVPRGMAAKTPATVEELRAELDRVRRESLRAETERARAEEYKGRLETRDKEIAQVREQLQKMLQAAEGQLAAAAAKIAEVSKPPPPNPQARELDDARIRAARLQAELAELRAEFDEMRRELDTARIEADGARTALGALQASLTVRDARADDALAALAAANERAEAAA